MPPRNLAIDCAEQFQMKHELDGEMPGSQSVPLLRLAYTFSLIVTFSTQQAWLLNLCLPNLSILIIGLKNTGITS